MPAPIPPSQIINDARRTIVRVERVSCCDSGVIGRDLTLEVNRPSRRPDAEQRREDTNKKEHGGS